MARGGDCGRRKRGRLNEVGEIQHANYFRAHRGHSQFGRVARLCRGRAASFLTLKKIGTRAFTGRRKLKTSNLFIVSGHICDLLELVSCSLLNSEGRDLVTTRSNCFEPKDYKFCFQMTYKYDRCTYLFLGMFFRKEIIS
jgi:hypothetical protein